MKRAAKLKMVIAFAFAIVSAADAADIPSAPEAAPTPVAADEWIVSTAPYFRFTKI